jgi:hypothetical protein
MAFAPASAARPMKRPDKRPYTGGVKLPSPFGETPSQAGLPQPRKVGPPTDPQMRAAAEGAQQRGITFDNMNDIRPNPFGHMGAPLDFHRWRIERGLDRGYNGGLGRAPQPQSPLGVAPAGPTAQPQPGLSAAAPQPSSGLLGPANQPMPQTMQGGIFNNLGAAAAQQVTGNMPTKTAGGLFGAPLGNYDPAQKLSPQQVIDQARGNQYAPTGATPLGSMAMNPDQLQSAKLAGHGLGGGVAVRDPNGQVRLQFETPREFGPQPGSDSRVYEQGVGVRGYKPGEALRPNAQQKERTAAAVASGKTGLSSTQVRQGAAARNAARIAGRGNAYALAQAKKESRQLNKGVLTFEQRLAAADPKAHATRKLGEGQLGLAKEQAAQRAQEAKDRIALGDRQIAGATERAKLGLSAAAVRAGEPDPFATTPKPGKTADKAVTEAEEMDLKGKSRAEIEARLPPELPPAARERIIREATRPGFWSRIFNPPKEVSDATKDVMGYDSIIGRVIGAFVPQGKPPVGLSKTAKMTPEQWAAELKRQQSAGLRDAAGRPVKKK